MTETRKQIIELIKPYMDKTLSEGCLLDFGLYTLRITEQHHIYKKDDGDIYCKQDTGDDVCIEDLRGEFKILGHYDITAVLKYFDKNTAIHMDTRHNEMITFYDFDDEGLRDDDIGAIPNKPLHLYSEQEEKDLLELLKKLGK